eukprot:TRINITY_DN25241_c0_g1_i1.p2 TRINITY_DN25241_c0_g1~~TRINITY_DN25241_c0_g1_i1.p2  ORF type:complete len:157 (-),score=31.99 TRINITY_DN25241_c0_g1_i1:56-526(-)
MSSAASNPTPRRFGLVTLFCGLVAFLCCLFDPNVASRAFSIACADNSGAWSLRIIGKKRGPGKLARSKGKNFFQAGDVIVVVGKTGSAKNKIMRAVMVRTKKPSWPLEKNGLNVFCDRFAAVIVDPHGNPVGSQIFGPMEKRCSQKWPKLAAITVG